jgi:uncharacterized protein (TIGR02147 family)
MEPGAIYLYSDFRQFLRDHYVYHKEHTRRYSFRAFSKAAGFSSPNFIKQVMDGEKNLAGDSAARLAGAMGLDEAAAAYFLDLVQFAQAKDLDAKRRALERIERRRQSGQGGPENLVDADAAYLKSWYLPVIRELAALPGFREEPAAIAKRLAFPVPAKDIRAALDFLIAHGFLQRDRKGRLRRRERVLATGDMSQKPGLAAAAREYHVQMAELAKQAIFQMPKEERSATNTTLSLSAEGYARALKRIEALRFELLELAASDPDARGLHQLNVTLFPLAREDA